MPENRRLRARSEPHPVAARPIEGVGTDTTAFVGVTAAGPPAVTPRPLGGYQDFLGVYGRPDDPPAGRPAGGPPDLAGILAGSVRAFFDNGGRRLYVSRVTFAPARSGAAAYAEALERLEAVEDVAIVAAPGASALDDGAGIQSALVAHADATRDRFAVLDTAPGLSVDAAREARGRLESSRAALYYPWVVAADPDAARGRGGRLRERVLPPSGFVCGVYARSDRERGVWKAPANLLLRGARRFERDLNKLQNEVLNQAGVNCLRRFPVRGLRVWGARTVSSDPEWKYVSMRRYLIFLEQSITRGMRWAVFEPNAELLWTAVRQSVTAFLHAQWRRGALLGGRPAEAYFVRCDRSTMTQDDIRHGRLVCLIGVAPARPSEFVIFRIGQDTAGR